MRSPRSWSVIALFFAAFPAGGVAEVVFESSEMLTRELTRVPARNHVAYTYDLVEDTDLVFALRATRWRRDPLRIWLLGEHEYEQMNAGRPFTYYKSASGLVKRDARFAFSVPRTSTYYVVLDNSEARSPREVGVYAYALTPNLSPEERETKRLYDDYYRELESLFQFEDFDIIIGRCGRPSAFYLEAVVICRELDDLLAESAPPDVRLFVLLHEVAHRFLDVWGYESIDHRQIVADRVAATVIELMGREESAAEAARWFESHESLVAGPTVAVPFSMSGSRSRRIAGWLTSAEHVERRWSSRILFPRMQTSALETMAETRELRPLTRKRIEDELSERRAELASR